MHPRRAVLLAAFMVSVSLSGCFGEAEVEEEAVVSSVWTFERPELTWYHFPDAVDVWGNDTVDFQRTQPAISRRGHLLQHRHVHL